MGKFIDLTGMKFNKLTVIKRIKLGDKKGAYWLCRCDCGNETVVRSADLKNEHTTSCGCKVPKIKNLIGETFGRLTVIGKIYKDNFKVYWVCQCSCKDKTIKEIYHTSLLNGSTTSCGCIKAERFKKLNRYNLSCEYGIGYTEKGEEFYFDLEDYNKIRKYYWSISSDGYVTAKKGNLRMHRFLMNCPDDKVVDHIYHVRHDNRKKYLRICSTSQNGINIKSLPKDNNSGKIGVCWNKFKNLWMAYISINKKQIVLGYFRELEDAISERIKYENIYYNEFNPKLGEINE